MRYVHDLHPLPAYIVLVTHEKTGGILNPWEDLVDYAASQIIYWGDAKKDVSKRSDDFPGNAVFKKVHDYLLEGHKQFAPPVIHFSKPAKGQVRFNGLCVLEKLEHSWFDDHGCPVRNYRAHLTILDEDEVAVSWLHTRAMARDAGELASSAPTAWKDYLGGKVRKLDLWQRSVRSQKDQLPPEGTAEARILYELHSLSPTEFEAVVVATFEQLTAICHSITRTRPVADGGFDFYGTFVLPHPFSYRIAFLGEAKKFRRSDGVQPKHVSRLVARLGRGQYGIFVTTSYYTRQAQQEVYQDGYPVRLISGSDLIAMMKELRIIRGDALSQVWLHSVRSGARAQGVPLLTASSVQLPGDSKSLASDSHQRSRIPKQRRSILPFATRRNLPFEVMTTANEFREWLERRKKPLKPASIKKYTESISTLSDYAGRPLLEITSFRELKSISEKVLRNSKFVALNDRGHGMYSAAFNHYSNFLRERFGE